MKNTILLFLLIFIIICFLKTSRNSNENFYNKDKLTGITPDSPESCKDPNDPEEICKNFDTCCMESLADKNCFCKNPVISVCMDDYKKCLNGEMYNDKNREYIGNNNIKSTCNNVRDKCCKLINKLKADNSYKKIKMIKGLPENELCSLNNTTDTKAKFCKNLCSLNEKCNFVIYNNSTSQCILYTGDTHDKAEYLAEGDSEHYHSYVKEPFTNYKDFCLNYDSNCGLQNQDKTECLCKHSIVENCLKNKDNCMKRNIKGVSKNLKKNICNNTFGLCCDVIKNIDVSEQFTFGKPVAGTGIVKNMLCKDNNKPLKFNNCRQECLNNPNCDYFETNLKSAEKFEPDKPRYCRMYSGSPKLTPPTFSKSSKIGKAKKIEVAKNIYQKKIKTES